MLKDKEKFKKEMGQIINEKDKEFKLDSIYKNVQRIMSALTLEYSKDSINKIHKHYDRRLKELISEGMGTFSIIFGVVAGYALAKGEIPLVSLSFGILFLLLLIKFIKLERSQKEYFRSPKYKEMILMREACMNDLKELI